jgi:nucleoside triphosphate pyrophosphatase
VADLAAVPVDLILASASPRRSRILRDLGLSFEVVVSGVDESMPEGEDPAASALRLARAKATSVAAQGRGLPVLAADTLVACDGLVLGKPEDADDAARMLRTLSGRTHQVVSGVCVVVDGTECADVARTAVTFEELTDAQIARYVATGEPLDKAGAYHIDGRGALFIRAITGSPSNVAGLPVTLVRRLLREAGRALLS